jgi:hypothetical protein
MMNAPTRISHSPTFLDIAIRLLGTGFANMDTFFLSMQPVTRFNAFQIPYDVVLDPRRTSVITFAD